MNHPSYRTAKTMYKNIMAQEPTNLSIEQDERAEIECARTLIQNGTDWGYPGMIKRGRGVLRRIRNRRLRKIIRSIPKRELSEGDAKILAERRNKFVEEVNRRIENDNQTTTPMS